MLFGSGDDKLIFVVTILAWQVLLPIWSTLVSECSVVMLWTYAMAAAFFLTLRSAFSTWLET